MRRLTSRYHKLFELFIKFQNLLHDKAVYWLAPTGLQKHKKALPDRSKIQFLTCMETSKCVHMGNWRMLSSVADILGPSSTVSQMVNKFDWSVKFINHLTDSRGRALIWTILFIWQYCYKNSKKLTISIVVKANILAFFKRTSVATLSCQSSAFWVAAVVSRMYLGSTCINIFDSLSSLPNLIRKR